MTRSPAADPLTTAPGSAPHPALTRGFTLLLSIAAGCAVGNLYWAQPLLELIARDLGASVGSAGWLVTATQLGYALGIALIVPLGDVLDRRRLVPVVLCCAAVALLLCSVAPTFGALLAAITLLGITTVSGQVLIPLAGDLAGDARRGEVVGVVTSGVLTGILVSRTLAGFVAGAAGWRAIYAVASVASLVLAVLLRRRIPVLPARDQLPYPALIASVATAVRRSRTVRWSLALGATQFATFTLFWTALTFLLSAPPFSYSVTVIGLFGLVGLAGAVAAQGSGRLHDRGWSLRATGAAWLLALVAFAVAAAGDGSVALLVVSVLLLDVAIQSLNILNASRLFAVSGEARSRVNTASITTNFVAGAVGSAAAGLLWSTGGWTAVTAAGCGLCLLGLALWAVGRRGPLVVRPRE